MKTTLPLISIRLKTGLPHKPRHFKITFRSILVIVLISFLLGFIKANATSYSWTGTRSGAWTNATDWTPAGVPAAHDKVIFNYAGKVTITGVPDILLNGLIITGSSDVTLVPVATGAQLTLSSDGSILNIDLNSSLTLTGNGASSLTVVFTGPGNTVLIEGTLNLIKGTGSGGGIYNTGHSLTTVSGTLATEQNNSISGKAINLTISPTGKCLVTGNSLTIPSAAWQPGSTLEIAVKRGGPLVNLNQSFSNIIINCPVLEGILQCNGALTTINGDFNLEGTSLSAGNSFRLTDSADYILNIKGNLNIGNNASLDLTYNLGYATLYLEGDLITGDSGELNITGMGNADIYFSKPAGVQNITLHNINSLNPATFSASVFIGTGSTANTVKMNTDINLGPNWSEVIVNKGSTLDFESFTVSGAAATFLADAGATIVIGAPDGISSNGISGNVRVGSNKTYSTSANYIYDGTTFQHTGTALIAAGNLTINNSSGVHQTNKSVTVNGALKLNAGIYTTGFTNVIEANSVTRISGHVNGNLQKKFTAGHNVSRNYEIGDATEFTPVKINFADIRTGGNLTASTSGGDHPNISSSKFNLSKTIKRCWTLSGEGIGFTNYSATFNYAAGDTDAGVNPLTLDAAIYNEGKWSYLAMGVRKEFFIQVTGVTLFSSFQIGTIAVESPRMQISGTRLYYKNGVVSWSSNDLVDHYILEKSTDGISFTGVTQIQARQGMTLYKYSENTEDIENTGNIENGEDHKILNPLYYRLSAADRNDSVHLLNIISLNTDMPASAPAVKLFPNPGNGFFNLEINSEKDTKAKLELMDRTSRIVFEERIHLTNGINMKTLELKALPKDLYLLKIITDFKVETIKMVIE